MNPENPSLPPLPQEAEELPGEISEEVRQPEAYDEEWFATYEKVGNFQTYSYFDGKAEYRNEQREAFESGDIVNPHLDYPKLDDFDAVAKEQELKDFKRDVLDAQCPEGMDPAKFEVVRRAYRWKINEKIAEARLLEATKQGDMKRFERYSGFVYGNPSPEIYNYTIAILQEMVASALDSEDETVRQAAAEMQVQMPKAGSVEPGSIVTPTDETFQAVKESTEGSLESLSTISIPDVSDESVKQAFELALEAIGAEGWTVIMNPDKLSLSANQETKTLEVRPGYIKTVEECKAIIYHEIGTHVSRRLNGERSKLKLLGLGLDRYEGGEEGVATLREQIADDDFKGFIHYDRFLAIALARGVDGEKRDFRGTYEKLQPIIRFYHLAAGESDDVATQQSKDEAWTICSRTFRGTDCQTPGACFTKDMIYREGNIATWSLLSRDLDQMNTFSIGKFDANNDRHLAILSELDISDDDLERLG